MCVQALLSLAAVWCDMMQDWTAWRNSMGHVSGRRRARSGFVQAVLGGIYMYFCEKTENRLKVSRMHGALLRAVTASFHQLRGRVRRVGCTIGSSRTLHVFNEMMRSFHTRTASEHKMPRKTSCAGWFFKQRHEAHDHAHSS